MSGNIISTWTTYLLADLFGWGLVLATQEISNVIRTVVSSYIGDGSKHREQHDTLQLDVVWFSRKVRVFLPWSVWAEEVSWWWWPQLPKQLPTSQVNSQNNNVCTIKGKVYCHWSILYFPPWCFLWNKCLLGQAAWGWTFSLSVLTLLPDSTAQLSVMTRFI